MTKDLIIIGGGGHTRALIGLIQVTGLPLRGIVTSSNDLLNGTVFDVSVLGLEDSYAMNPADVVLINGVGNLASKDGSGLKPRAALYQRYRAKGFDFPALISTAATLQPHVMMGEGVVVMAGAVVQPGCVIGENVIINTRSSVDHDTVIAPHCHIAPGVTICGKVTIGELTHIGAGATIIQGVTIGASAVIGAGVTVTRDVADGAVVRE